MRSMFRRRQRRNSANMPMPLGCISMTWSARKRTSCRPTIIRFLRRSGSRCRTSPTNIGLYLLSVLAARDCDFITSGELCRYAQGTLRSLSRMLTWNGHFYNWYDIRTLEVIGEPFISTVDSGNFVTSLVAFCEGMKEYVGECPALLDCVYAYEKLAFRAFSRAVRSVPPSFQDRLRCENGKVQRFLLRYVHERGEDRELFCDGDARRPARALFYHVKAVLISIGRGDRHRVLERNGV